MNIQNDLQGLQQILGPSGLSAGEKQTPALATGNAAAPNDEAHLSTAAYLVSQAAALPDVRTDKVAAIQTALANGSYRVSSSDVAARLIDFMQSNVK